MQIIVDTREQNNWFDSHNFSLLSKKLDEGDYSVKELCDIEEETGRKILRIERKASTAEIAINLGKERKRFLKEMERLAEYDHKYLIMEFPIYILLKFPEESGIPKNRWYRKNKYGNMVKAIKMTGNYMISLLEKIEKDFDIEVIYSNSRSEAEESALQIMKDVYEQETKKRV